MNAQARLTVDTRAAEPRLDGQHFWMSVTSDQPIAAERSMYWDRGTASLSEGHNSHGVVEPSRHWSTGDARVGGPQQDPTFMLVGNPTSSVANLTVTIKRDAGADIVSTRQLAPFGRDTINVNTAVPALSNESFWLVIDSDVPIVAERSQDWNPEGSRGSWSGGTNTFALPVVARDYNGCSYVVAPAQLTASPARRAADGQRRDDEPVHLHRRVRRAVAARRPRGRAAAACRRSSFRWIPTASPVARTGSITIAGRTVSIAQDAGAAAGVGDPQMALDAPLAGARVGTVFRVTGFAADLAAADGTAGVGAVHVWAYPAPVRTCRRPCSSAPRSTGSIVPTSNSSSARGRGDRASG